MSLESEDEGRGDLGGFGNWRETALGLELVVGGRGGKGMVGEGKSGLEDLENLDFEEGSVVGEGEGGGRAGRGIEGGWFGEKDGRRFRLVVAGSSVKTPSTRELLFRTREDCMRARDPPYEEGGSGERRIVGDGEGKRALVVVASGGGVESGIGGNGSVGALEGGSFVVKEDLR